VDLQPVRAALSQLFSHPEFEQRPSDVVRLRIDQLRLRWPACFWCALCPPNSYSPAPILAYRN
jgi:hypothetical protein